MPALDTYPLINTLSGVEKLLCSTPNTTDPANNILTSVLTAYILSQVTDITNTVVVTGTSQTIAPGTRYIANNAALITFTLPTVIAVGGVFSIMGMGAGGWQIAQNASQILHVGSSDTTPGVTGYVASTHFRDSARFVNIVANLEFQTEVGPQGNLTIF